MVEWEGIPEDISKYKGFVYLITCMENNKKYIGKKTFWFKTTKKPLKGRVNKRHGIKESDWRTYYGSSSDPAMLGDLEKYGKDNFKREILQCYKTEWECKYYEAKEQFARDVLRDPMYYNGWIKITITKRLKK